VVMFVADVIRLYRKAILRCKKLGQSELNQLLIDTSSVQSLLIGLVMIEGSVVESTTLQEMQQVVGILESMQAPPHNKVSTFLSLVGNSCEEFHQMLDTLDGFDTLDGTCLKAGLITQFEASVEAGGEVQELVIPDPEAWHRRATQAAIAGTQNSVKNVTTGTKNVVTNSRKVMTGAVTGTVDRLDVRKWDLQKVNPLKRMNFFAANDDDAKK